jgi:hypothetical protein
VEYKAEYEGLFVDTIDPRNTSKRCDECRFVLDILLRLKAGGIPSGGSFRFAVQSPDYHTFRAQVVPQYRCGGLLAVPSRRYPYPRRCTASRCCFGHGDASRCQQSRGYRLARFRAVGTLAHASSMCLHRLPFRILSRYVGGQAASGGRFGIRSVPTDSYLLTRRPVS